MTNHIHLIASAEGNLKLFEIVRDFKKFTNKLLIRESNESRKKWLLIRAGIVSEPEHYLYSSASNYGSLSGILEVELLDVYNIRKIQIITNPLVKNERKC